jgi:hypothetical protein
MTKRPVAAAHSPRMTGLRRKSPYQTLIPNEIMRARDSMFRAFCFSANEDDPGHHSLIIMFTGYWRPRHVGRRVTDHNA